MFISMILLANAVCFLILFATYRSLRFVIGVGKVYYKLQQAKNPKSVISFDAPVRKIEPVIQFVEITQPAHPVVIETQSESSEQDPWALYDSPAYLRKGVAVFC